MEQEKTREANCEDSATKAVRQFISLDNGLDSFRPSVNEQPIEDGHVDRSSSSPSQSINYANGLPHGMDARVHESNGMDMAANVYNTIQRQLKQLEHRLNDQQQGCHSSSTVTREEGSPDTQDQCPMDDFDRLNESDSDNNETQGDQDAMDEMEMFFQSDKQTSEDVSSRLATIVNGAMGIRVPEKKKMELLEKYLRPKNCKLVVPKVNKGVWQNLKKPVKDMDVKLQTMQQMLGKGMFPILRLTDVLLKARSNPARVLLPEDIKVCMGLANDSFKLLQMLHNDMSYRRSFFLLKPEINRDFRDLCGYDNPVGETLFGNDLDQKIKQLEEEIKVSKKVAQAGPINLPDSSQNNNTETQYHRQSTKESSRGQINGSLSGSAVDNTIMVSGNSQTGGRAELHSTASEQDIDSLQQPESSTSLTCQDYIANTPLIKRFMKGVFTTRPALPRYSNTWDVTTVLNFLKTLSPATELTLLDLSCKLTMLLALVTGQQGQSLHSLTLKDLDFQTDRVTINFSSLLKTSKPGHHQKQLSVRKYDDETLCVVQLLLVYIDRTALLRKGEEKLFVSTVPPHQAISRETLSRWIKTILHKSGVDTNVYRAHSTRAAACSTAVRKGLPLQTIMQAVGWSAESTFRKFYDRPIAPEASLGAIIDH